MKGIKGDQSKLARTDHQDLYLSIFFNTVVLGARLRNRPRPRLSPYSLLRVADATPRSGQYAGKVRPRSTRGGLAEICFGSGVKLGRIGTISRYEQTLSALGPQAEMASSS